MLSLNLILLCAAMALATAVTAAGAQTGRMQYPAARKVDQADDYHGVRVADPYRWLEDTDSPETGDWVRRENEVTSAYLNKLPQREAFRRRLTELWDYAKYSAPFHEGGRYFYFKNDGLQNQSVLYWRESLAIDPREPQGSQGPHVLLDPNPLSLDGTVALSATDVSNDGRTLAYALSASGSDWQTFHIRDVTSGDDLPDELKWTKFTGAAWTHDNRGFLYSRYPAPKDDNPLLAVNSDQKLYYHVVGEPQSKDALIYERPEHPDWGIGASLTEDGRYAILYLYVGTDPRNRIYYMDIRDPKHPNLKAPVVELLDDFDASYGVLGNDGPIFYVKTDLGAPRSRVIAIDTRQPERHNWRTILPESEDSLQSAMLIGDRIVALYLHNASSQIRMYNLSGKHLKTVRLPGIGTVGGLTGKRADSQFFYTFTSYLCPPTIYRYDVRRDRSFDFRKPDLKFDPAGYETKQVWYQSKDGTRVPMFVTSRKGLKLDGSSPCYLTGYGGFDVSVTPGLSLSALIWMENGGIYAVPNLRGGGEFGEEWHKAGTVLHKQNVFDDFIAAAEYLVQKGYTSPKRLVIAGGSNGGLLIGAAMTQRPDLFAVALPAVGVMDMLRYHKFTIGWMWASDYGTSDDPKQFKALYAYSPLHNLKPGTRYPATLVTTADHDDRVVPGHSFKFAATLQACQVCNAPVLIRVETKAGHGGGKPTDKIIEEASDVWAFAMQNVGMKTIDH